ncbi:MAG: 4-phosphopantetheinyl transferase family protein [Cyclobacteriaceae bacterium]|nr:4-phosphopantetheinyl transferase family protein [Cyclobacteriaceae bacterium]
MIGNDIVDMKLALKEKPWENSRYLNKVFTHHEQSLIAGTNNKGQMLWRLWSMKESAYKIYLRKTGIPVFSPISIQCQPTCPIYGFVEISGACYRSKTQVTNEYIYTTALSMLVNQRASVSITLSSSSYSMQHRESYGLAKSLFGHIYSCDSEDLKIVKNPLGVPEFVHCGVRQSTCLSITHHGRFAGVAIADENWPTDYD